MFLQKRAGKGLAVALVLLALCLVGSQANAVGRLVIEGSTTVLPIAQRTAEAYMNNNPEVNITVRGGGSGVGLTSLIAGTCDIAISSRPIKTEEIQRALKKGIDPKGTVVALDAIAVIVHPSNKIDELARKQIKDIYTGRISNWSGLGGRNEKIVVISRDSSSGTYEAFGELVLDKERVRPDALLQASNQAVAGAVSRTPGAIGYIGLGYVSPSVKILTIEGVAPSEKTILSNKYPITRPLFMYTNGKPKGLTKSFLDFVLSPEGQRHVREEGSVPLK